MPLFLDMYMAEIIPQAGTMTLLSIHIYCQMLSFCLSPLCLVTVFLPFGCCHFLLSCQINTCYVVVQFSEIDVRQWRTVILTTSHIQFGSVHLFHKQDHHIHMDIPQLEHTCHRDFHTAHQHRHSLIHT